MIHTSEEPLQLPERQYDIGFATKRHGQSKGYVLQVRIPRGVFGDLDEPKRIMIEGTPHEGYMIKPTRNRAEGYAVNYRTGGLYYYFVVAFRPTKLTKCVRKMTVATGEVKDGAVRVGGMPQGWIRGSSEFVEDAAPPAKEFRLAASPVNGSLPQPVPPVVRQEEPPISVQEITAKLDGLLREAAALKTMLERRTGLVFRVSQDLRLILGVDK